MDNRAGARDDHTISAAYPPDMLAPDVIRLDLRDPDGLCCRIPLAVSIILVAPDILEPDNQMFHYGNPKYLARCPRTAEQTRWVCTFCSCKRDRAGRGRFKCDHNLETTNDGILRVLLIQDHTYVTSSITSRTRLAELIHTSVKWDPALKKG